MVIEPLFIDFVIYYIFAFYIFDNLNHIHVYYLTALLNDYLPNIKVVIGKCINKKGSNKEKTRLDISSQLPGVTFTGRHRISQNIVRVWISNYIFV